MQRLIFVNFVFHCLNLFSIGNTNKSQIIGPGPLVTNLTLACLQKNKIKKDNMWELLCVHRCTGMWFLQ